MHVLKSHDIIRYSCFVYLLLSYFHTFSQCPFTQSILLPLESNGQAHAQALDFFVNPDEVVSTALNRDVYGCANVGIQEIKLDIIDQKNRPYTCRNFIVISDPIGFCSDVPQLPKAVLGKIVTPYGSPVQGATIGISDDTNMVFRSTNEDGLFLFDDLPKSTYTLEPKKNNDLKNGVTTQDIILLQKHLLKIKTFDNPYQYIAADVNNSGDITAFDMILLRQIILNSIQQFPNNSSWKFIKIDYQFQNLSNPLKDDLDNIRTIDFAPSLSMNNNYIGVKIGDLNNSVYANQTILPRNKNTFEITVKDQQVEQGEEVYIDFQVPYATEVEGFQLALQLNSKTIELIEVDKLPKEAYRIEKGQLFISNSAATGISVEEVSPLFSLKVKALQTGLLSDFIHQSKRSLVGEIYTKEITKSLDIHFSEDKSTNTVGKIFPNPFVTTTFLPIELQEATVVNYKIYNLQGQALLEQMQWLDKGVHNILLEASFPINGIYIYEVSIQDQTYVGKLNYIGN